MTKKVNESAVGLLGAVAAGAVGYGFYKGWKEKKQREKVEQAAVNRARAERARKAAITKVKNRINKSREQIGAPPLPPGGRARVGLSKNGNPVHFHPEKHKDQKPAYIQRSDDGKTHTLVEQYKNWLIETNGVPRDVHRVDPGHNTPSSWGPGARTYASNKTGTESGQKNPLHNVDPRYSNVRKGVYGHVQRRDAARYAAGRNWIHHEDGDGNHILTLPARARNSGWENNRVTHTTFSGKHFESIPGSGEHISKERNSGLIRPKTTQRSTAGKVVKDSGLQIRYAPHNNLHDYARELENQGHSIHGVEGS